MIKFPMVVNKKDDKTKKYVEVGAVEVTVPVLDDLLPFMAAKVTGQEEGVPVYDSAEANWLMSAVMAYTKANARNKLESGTATIKSGLVIPSTWAEFTAEGVRGGGEALAIIREAKTAFAEWLGKQGKSDAVTNTLTTLFNNRAALQLQSPANKAKVKTYVEQFAEALDAPSFERFTKPIEAVIAACEATDDALADLE